MGICLKMPGLLISYHVCVHIRSGVAAFKGADVAWAISQQYIESGMDNGRTVHLAIKRGFAKTEEPWLPPMQSPADPLASPASSMVESLNSDDDIPEVMSAPGSRTFSGDGAAGRRRALGETNAKDRKVPVRCGSDVSHEGILLHFHRGRYGKAYIGSESIISIEAHSKAI